MFRITRGHHVQHIHFPFPLTRNLDALDDEEPRDDSADGEPPAPSAARDNAEETDSQADTPQ